LIEVTRLDGRPMVLNAELIESVESTPDTLIQLSTGRKILVRETVDEVTMRVLKYRERTYGCHYKATAVPRKVE